MVTPEVGDRLLSLYLAKGVAATTAIEGNTLSEKEVLQRIKRRKPLPQSQEYQGKEIPSSLVGEKVMKELQRLDGVAYVRFASVYRQFRDVGEFLEELKDFLNVTTEEEKKP